MNLKKFVEFSIILLCLESLINFDFFSNINFVQNNLQLLHFVINIAFNITITLYLYLGYFKGQNKGNKYYLKFYLPIVIILWVFQIIQFLFPKLMNEFLELPEVHYPILIFIVVYVIIAEKNKPYRHNSR